MIQKIKINKVIIGRFKKGDDVITKLEDILKKEKIQMGFISIIGAVEEATIGYYNQKKKEYIKKHIKSPMEILSMKGNISLKEGNIFIHLHGIFGKRNFKTTGGHIFSPTRIFAGEFIIMGLKGKVLERKYDLETGLYLW